MLGDQRSPYVGRFARGWHRLPGFVPGQPQTRTGARPSIDMALRTARTTRSGRPVGERATGGEQVDLARSPLEERCSARRSRGARRQHIVDEKEASRRGATGDASERIGHRQHPFLAGPAGLGSGRLRPSDEGDRREIQLACERPREHAEPGRSRARPAAGMRAAPTSRRRPAAGRAPPGRRRMPPRPRASRRTSAGGPRPWPVPGRRTPLAPTRSAPEDSPRISRRSWAGVDRNDGTTVASAGGAPPRTSRRTATGLRHNRRRPSGRERRSPSPARRHATSCRRHGQGSATSIGSPAPLTAIVRACWVFNSG